MKENCVINSPENNNQLENYLFVHNNNNIKNETLKKKRKD